MSLSHFLISFLIAYLLGSIPFGYLVGKIFYQKNLLELGSGNIGTTNTFRNLGWAAGLLVMVLDIAKGSFGALAANLWGAPSANWWYFAVGLGAILGHTCSVWIKFKGGKAVATSVGVLLVYDPQMFYFAFAVFLSLIFLTSTISLASMIGFVCVTLMAAYQQDWTLFLIALLLSIFVIYRHRSNIIRLKNGTESMVHFGCVYWLKQAAKR